MATDSEIKKKFWNALKHDRTIMLGLAGVEEGHAQPMTALIEGDEGGPIWIFTAKDTDLAQAIGRSHPAIAQFAAKGHELFASIEGEIMPDNDRAVIDRLWSPFIAAWFKGGKDDPKLLLLRFEPSHAQIWLNENSLWAGIKLLLGRDPKREFKDKVADVRLS